MLGCTEELTAEYFSARSGDMTVDVNSTMTVRQTIAIAQIIPQYRSTDGVGKRRLLTPDEVFRLPNNEMLIIIRGEKVLRANKFDYIGHPYAKRIIKTSALDYRPNNKQDSQTETETARPKAADSSVPVSFQRKPTGSGVPKNRTSPGKKKIAKGVEVYDPLCQTETEDKQDEAAPENNPFLRQTDIKIPPDTPEAKGGSPSSAEGNKLQSQSDTGVEIYCPLNAGPEECTVQPKAKTPSGQTESKNPQKKPTRAAKAKPTEPDYSFVLESFKPQSKNATNPSKRDPPKDDAIQESPLDEMDTGVHIEKSFDSQTDTEPPPETAAPQLELPEVPDTASSQFGGNEPPDDF